MEHDPTSVRLGREPVRNDSCVSRYLGISSHRHSKNQPVRKSGSGASADNSLRSVAEALKGTLVSGGKRLEIRHFCFAACGSSIRQEVFAGPKSLDAPEPAKEQRAFFQTEAPPGFCSIAPETPLTNIRSHDRTHDNAHHRPAATAAGRRPQARSIPARIRAPA